MKIMIIDIGFLCRYFFANNVQYFFAQNMQIYTNMQICTICTNKYAFLECFFNKTNLYFDVTFQSAF